MPKLKQWLMIFWGALIVLLAAIAAAVYSFVFIRSPEPSSVPIKLTESGFVADFKFKVRKHASYWYFMKFDFPENDSVKRAHVKKLLGGNGMDKAGKALEPGIPTPIHLSIFAVCKDGKEMEIYSQDIDPILASWGQGSFTKNIGSQLLTPGVYRAHFVNKRASKEFLSIPVAFEIGMSANTNFDSTKRREGANYANCNH